jgi:excisionase family DNA binding protein
MKSEPQIPGREGRFAYSINEVCATTNLGRDAVYCAISAGQLVARKLGRRTLITDDDLRQFLAGLPRAGGHEQVAVRSTEAEQARERA